MMEASNIDEVVHDKLEPQPVEIPSLRDIVLCYINKNVKKIDMLLSYYFRGQAALLLDSKFLAKLLLSVVNFVNIDILKQVEDIVPALLSEEENEIMWKKVVQRRYAVREITAPFPVIVGEVKTLLSQLKNEKTSTSEKQVILDKFSCLPFSRELAKQTGVALAVNSLRKDRTIPSSLAITAAEITSKWKKLFRAQNDTEFVNSGGNFKSSAGIDCEKILTWRDLYHYYENKERSMVEKGTEVFSNKSQIESNKRRTSLSTNSSEMISSKKLKLQKIESSGSVLNPGRVKPTVFLPLRNSTGAALFRSVKNEKGHSAVDLMCAKNLESTKKMKVITSSSGGIMKIPKHIINKNKR